MAAQLVGISDGVKNMVVDLPEDKEVLLGRSDAATVSLLDDKVSRLHSKIEFSNGLHVVEDLDSSNGTWVNGRQVKRAILFNFDSIVLGSQEFRFELEDASIGQRDTPVVEDQETDMFATEIRERIEPDASSSVWISIATAEEGAEIREELALELSSICRVSQAVSVENDIDRLFEEIMEDVMKVSKADRGYLIVARDPQGPITPRVCRYREGVPGRAKRAFSRTIVRESYETGHSILLSDPLEDRTLLADSKSIFQQQIQSILCVPLLFEEGCVGVVYVDTIVGSKKFTKRDLMVLSAIANQAGMAIRRAQLTRQVEDLFSDCIRTLVNIVEAKDEYTYGHSERVTAVAMRLADRLGLERAEMRDLRLAGLMHDVGKVGMSLQILQKPGRLTDSEYMEVKKHPEMGAKVIATIDNAEHIAKTVRHHHERWDGGGYPAGLSEDDIPVLARLIALADSYDAMASTRPYRDVMPKEEIVQEIEEGIGSQFDPEMAHAFLEGLTEDASFVAKLEKAYLTKSEEAELQGAL